MLLNGLLSGVRARRAQPQKVFSSFEPITEFEPTPAAAPSTPLEVTSSTTGSDNVGGRIDTEVTDGRTTVGDVLRQTVDFLVYEVNMLRCVL